MTKPGENTQSNFSIQYVYFESDVAYYMKVNSTLAKWFIYANIYQGHYKIHSVCTEESHCGHKECLMLHIGFAFQ